MVALPVLEQSIDVLHLRDDCGGLSLLGTDMAEVTHPHFGTEVPHRLVTAVDLGKKKSLVPA